MTDTSDKLGKNAQAPLIGQPVTTIQMEAAEQRQISDINYIFSRQNAGLLLSICFMFVAAIGLIIIGVLILDTII